MKPKEASSMFANFGNRMPGNEYIDLVQLLEDLNIVLDFSSCTNFSGVFNGGKISRIGVVNTTSCKSLATAIFYSHSIITIEKVILKEDGSQTFNNYTFYAPNLQNLTIEGVIGNSGANFQQCKALSQNSIISIINALSTTTSGLSITLSLAAVNKAFEIAEGDNNGSISTEWTALVATRSNWTINLV